MNPASHLNLTIHITSRLALASIAGALTLSLFSFAAVPKTRADIPASELKIAGAIPLTTELLDKMEKFVTSAKADAAAKAELNAIPKENKHNAMAREAASSSNSVESAKSIESFQ